MLNIYCAQDGTLKCNNADQTIPNDFVWADMIHPTQAEEKAVENILGIDIPTREEMHEIEVSSRLYQENGTKFMTAVLIVNGDTDQPEAQPVTFVFDNQHLVTIRYTEPKSFDAFISRAKRPGNNCSSAETTLLGIIETVVDRAADHMERLVHDVDNLSRDIFRKPGSAAAKEKDFQDVLRGLGSRADLISKVNESLVSIGRLVTFLAQSLEISDSRLRADTLNQDVHSLIDHTSFLSDKITFLLSATLGMINIEQNSIIKIFTVAAVGFLPPTLVASIYGMNFDLMPELKWDLGYLWALGLMVMSAIGPFFYFKRRGWL
jgi:magnesium transporter